MTTRLQELRQWVCWEWEQRDGKATKVPFSPHEPRRAKSDDPTTWGTLTEARQSARERDYEGVGFVFTAEDPFCGVDLDAVLNPETGEVEEWAMEIVRELDSYTEISPSGNGLHIILRAELPAGGNRKGRIEIYDRGRFFTVTGHHLPGTPKLVKDRQPQLDALHRRLFPARAVPSRNGYTGEVADEDLIEKATAAANGEKFRLLWSGDWEGAGYGSRSEADLALCSMIAFWTGPDEVRVADLFSRSGLAREKWARPDYRQRTLSRALEGAKFYRPPEVRPPRKAPEEREGVGGGRDTEYSSPVVRAATLPEALVFPLEVLPAECRGLTEEAAGALGCAPELVALPMLAALSSAAGATRLVEIKRGWKEGTTLFLAVVASPGAMKSPAARVALAAVHECQEDHKACYAQDKEAYEQEYREWEVERKLAGKNNEPAPEQPKAPSMRRAIVSDTTLEALVGLLEDNARGFLVHRDEIAGWLRSMDQYRSGGKGSDRQHWLSMWDNQPFVVDRKSRLGEPIILSRPVVSLFGGIQPAMLGEMGGAMEDGMMDRFLFGYPAARRIRYNEREVSEEAEKRYADLYRRLAALPLAIDENGAPNPKVLKLTLDSKRRFAEAVDSLGDETLEPGFPVRLEGAWSKMRSYLARISLLLALCRCSAETKADGTGDRPERVEVEDVEGACTLVGYFKAHAKRVYAELREADPLDVLGEELKAFLEEEGGHWAGTPTELHEELMGRDAEEVPANAVNLTKRVLAIAGRSAGLEARRGKSDGTRTLHLTLKSTVRTVPSDPVPASDGASRATRDSKSGGQADGTWECMHGFAGGQGCYLCDPQHPYRLQSEAVT